MKKIFLLIVLVTLSFSCSNDDDGGSSNEPVEVTCGEALSLVVEKRNDYENDPYELTCNAYKAALQQQITVCGDVGGEIQEIVDGLNCSAE